ncbi:hypothetical protein P691DRAFT_774767 [Macrolepiota fuliginosa MF-IS2]|uniref:C2H2-type domain-containing protein n=1 Tax=Macrolepiota fuliginosa MF-IS2 TaxID=1400762 RepID=A0A9P5XEN3_9AGAR|nr:hypothetical protein P691DRAFT_774767 [Macrolepiota fuliginosa MF-IS2]
MQAQYNISSSCPPPIDYYHTSTAYSTVHDQYLATGGGDIFAGSFSRGSSLAYPHEDYRYMTDRGGPSGVVIAGSGCGLPTTSYAPVATTSIAFDATGLGFTENNNLVAPVPASGREYCHPEDISGSYEQTQGWQWECHSTGQATIAPPPHPPPYPLTHASALPRLPNATGASGVLPPPDPVFVGSLTSTIKSAVTVGQSQTYPVRSPTAQLPTPAAMAILLNPNGRRRERTPQIAMDPASASLSVQQPPSMMQMSSSVADTSAVMPVPDMLSREKKHACTMCHKRFDRPSTLRKHLLVHTGEKAFVCETCGRRFGVASNLNRHVRRCILKPVNAAVSSATSSSVSPSSASGPPSDMSANHLEPSNGKAGAPKRGRALSSTGSTSSSSTSSSNSQSPTQKDAIDGAGQKTSSQKRRRRAPSPSLWIPWSLRAFNLACEEYYRSTPVPLPPVRRNLPREERDSWDENVSTRPYHPHEWKGVLPGPGLGHGLGLGGKDVRNINFGGSGGIMLGRVLVF